MYELFNSQIRIIQKSLETNNLEMNEIKPVKTNNLEWITKIDTLDNYLSKINTPDNINYKIVQHLQKIIKYINNNKIYSDESKEFLNILKQNINNKLFRDTIPYNVQYMKNVKTNNNREQKNELNKAIKEMFDYELNDEEYKSLLIHYYFKEEELYCDDHKMLIYIYLKKRYYIKKCYCYLIEKYLKSITIIDETIIMYICKFF